MRTSRTTVGALGLAGTLVALAGALPAAAAAPLRWDSPKHVSSGVPVVVSSITPCPPPPTSGVSVTIGFGLLFPAGGGVFESLPASSDGTWSGSVTFGFSVSGKASLIATCSYYNGVTGVAYAQYKPASVKLG
jgi:hypothetical protein